MYLVVPFKTPNFLPSTLLNCHDNRFLTLFLSW
jgi:hypothetical protein